MNLVICVILHYILKRTSVIVPGSRANTVYEGVVNATSTLYAIEQALPPCVVEAFDTPAGIADASTLCAVGKPFHIEWLGHSTPRQELPTPRRHYVQ